MKKLIYFIFIGISLLLLINSCGSGGGSDAGTTEPKIEVTYPESGEIVVRVVQTDGDAFLNYYGSSPDDITKIVGSIENQDLEVLYKNTIPTEISINETKILYTYNSDDTINYKYYYKDILESESTNLSTRRVPTNLSEEDFKAVIIFMFSIARKTRDYNDTHKYFMNFLLTHELVRSLLNIEMYASSQAASSSEISSSSPSSQISTNNPCPAYEAMVDEKCKNYYRSDIPTQAEIQDELDRIENIINRVCPFTSSEDFTIPKDTSGGTFISCYYEPKFNSMAQTPFENNLRNGIALYYQDGTWAYAPFKNGKLDGWYYHLYSDNSIESLTIHHNGLQAMGLGFGKDGSWYYGINNEIYVNFHSNLNQVKDIAEFKDGKKTRSMSFDINGKMTECLLWGKNGILTSCM